MGEQYELEPINGGKAFFIVVGTLALVFFNIFARFDPQRWIYTTILVFLSVMCVRSMRFARKEGVALQNGPVFFFVLVWLGINAFSDLQFMVNFGLLMHNIANFFNIDINFELTLSIKSINSLLLLPLAIIWVQPHNSDNFFGFTEIGDDIKNRSIWKISVVLILLLRIFSLSTFFEFLVLIPLIAEPVVLYKQSKDELPLLTLHIHQELTEKFAVPISMAKGIVLIMISFTFGLIEGKLWLLVILGYLLAGFIWFIDFIVPESARQSNSKDVKDFDDIKAMFESSGPDDGIAEIRNTIKENTYKFDIDSDKVKGKYKTKKDVQNLEITSVAVSDDNRLPTLSDDATIGEKAHALGRRVRTELQKPQYNLNHIMSTLSKEDFSMAYRVPKNDLLFGSKEGNWSPPKDLLLFPIELEEYDYRRADEILLLGFNEPIQEGKTKIQIDFGDQNKYNTKISGNQIQVGDTTFHMKTLVLSREDWEKAKLSLEIVNDVDDISYTGFKTLHELQEKLSQISEKWIEFRKQAEDAAINFLAGLLGSKEPIFLSKEEMKENLIEGEVIIDVEEDQDV